MENAFSIHLPELKKCPVLLRNIWQFSQKKEGRGGRESLEEDLIVVINYATFHMLELKLTWKLCHSGFHRQGIPSIR